MTMYVAKNGETLGPFDKGTVSERLEGGEFSLDDSVCIKGEENWRKLRDIFPEEQESAEMFSSITKGDTNTGGSSKAGSLVVLACIILTLFFGGWVSLIVATIIYLPFRKQSNGWLIFLIAYITSNFSFFFLIRSLF